MKTRDLHLWRKPFDLLIILVKGALDSSGIYLGMKITMHIIYEGSAIA